MKKVLSVLLCAAMITMLTPTAFAATGGCKNVLSETIWNFSESSDAADYGRVDATEASPIVIADATGYDGSKALSITRGSDGKNANISFLDHASATTSVSDVEVKFKFMVTGQDALFKFVFRDTGDYNALACQGGNVTFLGQNVTTYSKNKWYDVEMYVSIERGYGQLRFREITNPESVWNEYFIFAGESFLSGKTETCRLAIGIQNSAAIAYIDDYYQNTANKPLKFLSSDDFSNGIDGWKPSNVQNFVSASQYDLNGNSVLKIGANEGETIGGTNTNLSKTIPEFAVSANTNYYFRFKFGGKSQSGSFGASLQTAEGTSEYKELAIVKVAAGDVRLFGGITAAKDGISIGSSFGQVDENTLYDAEAVYNPYTGSLTSVLTNAEGKQFINTYADGGIAGRPTRFAFRNSSVNTETPVSIAYFDDFETDILDANGPVFKDCSILSGEYDEASIDETAVFTYDRTINQAELANATVTLNNEILDAEDYTITSKGNEVFVTLNKLEKNTPYTVTLAGVKDILGEEAKDETGAVVSFKTADATITAEKPELNGTKLSSFVTSYYAQGKTIKFILAVYNDAETVIEAVKVIDVTVSDRNGKIEEADFSEILASAAGKKVKGFVWDSFGTMEPYAETYVGTYNN